MSQAEKSITTNLSRRSALAGLAGAATAGVAPAIAAAGDDADLLALKAEFDPLFEHWVALNIKQRDEHNALIEFHERATGAKYDDRPSIDWDNPVWVAHQKAWEKSVHDYYEQNDPAAAEDVWDNLRPKLNRLADEILSYNASTLEGLRLQLRALISADDETWESGSYEIEELEHPWMRDFIESAAGVLGVPFPPY